MNATGIIAGLLLAQLAGGRAIAMESASAGEIGQVSRQWEQFGTVLSKAENEAHPASGSFQRLNGGTSIEPIHRTSLMVPIGADMTGLSFSGGAKGRHQTGVRPQSRVDAPRSVSAAMGWWGNDGAIEAGIFKELGSGSALRTRLIQSATGRRMATHGARLAATIHQEDAEEPLGWSLRLEARHQRIPDADAALRGARRHEEDSRVAFSGRLLF